MAKNIDLYVVENHNEVLEPLYRKIGSKKLPFHGMCILHFDSHSDMSVPKDLQVSEDGMLSKHEVFEHTSIENWIIPTLYSGHINSVVWLHPSWTSHSFEKENFFKVGHSPSSNFVKVTSTSNHFLSEESFEFERDLKNCKEVQFVVQCIDPRCNPTESSEVAEKLRNIIRKHEDTFILDIDLDFFSTRDPFKNMLKKEHYEVLKQSYEFIPPLGQDSEDLRQCMLKRKYQLDCLKKRISDWSSNLQQKLCTSTDTLTEMLLQISLTEDDYDYMWLHEIGTGIDDCPLPDHVSTEDEVDELVRHLGILLSFLPPPSVIFIARSSEDDYCPVDQVDVIQTKVLKMLKQTYKNINETFLYDIK